MASHILISLDWLLLVTLPLTMFCLIYAYIRRYLQVQKYQQRNGLLNLVKMWGASMKKYIAWQHFFPNEKGRSYAIQLRGKMYQLKVQMTGHRTATTKVRLYSESIPLQNQMAQLTHNTNTLFFSDRCPPL